MTISDHECYYTCADKILSTQIVVYLYADTPLQGTQGTPPNPRGEERED